MYYIQKPYSKYMLSFQTCMSSFLMLNNKKYILKNVDN